MDIILFAFSGFMMASSSARTFSRRQIGVSRLAPANRIISVEAGLRFARRGSDDECTLSIGKKDGEDRGGGGDPV